MQFYITLGEQTKLLMTGRVQLCQLKASQALKLKINVMISHITNQ